MKEVAVLDLEGYTLQFKLYVGEEKLVDYIKEVFTLDFTITRMSYTMRGDAQYTQHKAR